MPTVSMHAYVNVSQSSPVLAMYNTSMDAKICETNEVNKCDICNYYS